MYFRENNALIPRVRLTFIDGVDVAEWKHRAQPDKYYQHLIMV